MKNSLLFILVFIANLGIITAQNIDYQILKNLSKLQNPSDNKFNKFVSDADAPICIGVPLLIFSVGLIEKNKDLQEKGFQTGVAFAATLGGTYALKYLINRPRPYITYPDLKNLTTEGTASFPSGHTSAIFSIATSLSLNFRKWYVAVPAYTWAAATGYSRMYLNVHYPSDVLAGAILGSGTAWLTWKINKKWRERALKKKEMIK
jgi:membrane-associated phospholipid phosphatase